MARPIYRFRDFIGQKKKVDLLVGQLNGAKARGEPFPPTCFAGPSGVGKTLLARTLAAEYGTSLISANGYESVAELSSRFISVSACDFVFLDEAHRLAPKVQELLYHVIDDRRVPLWEVEPAGRCGEPTDNHRPINPCTVIVATDQPGRLLNALHKRIELPVYLDYYSGHELKELVDRLAADLDLLISPQAAKLIAEVSGGLPRMAKQHLRNLRRHFPDCESRQIDVSLVRKFLQAFQIDDEGLGVIERKYLHHLLGVERASLESLSLAMGFDSEFIRHQVEPPLLRKQFVVVRPGGRQLTSGGRDWGRRSGKDAGA